MSIIDYGIVILYLGATLVLGLLLQKRASAGIDSYFLGNRGLPWWALGASGMASNLDVSGTMINAAWIFAPGAAGLFIEIRGGVLLEFTNGRQLLIGSQRPGEFVQAIQRIQK